MDFKPKKYKRLLICLVIVVFISLQFPNCGFAASTINVTVNSSNIVATNSFSLGFQLNGADVSAWCDSSALRQLSREANFKLIRFFEQAAGKPCIYWNETTKTGRWDWTKIDLLVRRIFDVGAEPLIVLGFISFDTKRITSAPAGMSYDPKTNLPYPDQWAAYCAEWVKHFKQVGLPVRYYEMINEAYHYFGWSATQPKLSYFMALYNAATKAMRNVNPAIKVGNDACTLKTVMDYFISNGENLDFLSYHTYGAGAGGSSSLSVPDAEIFKTAETQYIGETTNVYGVDKAKQLYKAKRGIDLPVIRSENNLNYHFTTGTDPRIQKMQGAVYQALTFRISMLKKFYYSCYFHFASSATKEQTKPSGGLGFGMVNLDDEKPWYPYYVHKMIGNNLAVGDRIVESSSNSEDMRVIAWIHEGKLNVLLILKVNELRTIYLKGITNQINYFKLDNSVSWKTPKIQTGTISPSNPLTLNGYTVMLLQAGTSVSQATQTPDLQPTQSSVFL